jgi:hypothetical protein
MAGLAAWLVAWLAAGCITNAVDIAGCARALWAVLALLIV